MPKTIHITFLALFWLLHSRATVVTRASVVVCPSYVVHKNRLVGYHWMNERQILGTGTYPPYLKSIFFNILIFFFSFSLTWNHMGEKNSNDISSESTHQIPSQKSRILLGRVTTKVVQRIVKFQILDFGQLFFSFFVNMEPYGSKSFKCHLLWKYTSDSLSINMHTA